jgi:ankyrin repeat protein
MPRERREITTTGPAAAIAPLFAAMAAGDPNAVRQSLHEGADPNQRNGSGQTPLMAAARRGNEAIVRLLLAAGADRALRDPQGLSAADHAERAGHRALLPLLQ